MAEELVQYRSCPTYGRFDELQIGVKVGDKAVSLALNTGSTL